MAYVVVDETRISVVVDISSLEPTVVVLITLGSPEVMVVVVVRVAAESEDKLVGIVAGSVVVRVVVRFLVVIGRLGE